MIQAKEIAPAPAHNSSAVTAGAAFINRDLLSIDVEDYFHVEAFADTVSRSDWPAFPSRVRRNTERILELLCQYQQKATFFILGVVAERDPALIRQIAEAGHEIGCHSYAHYRVFTLTPAVFRDDLRRAKSIIEDATGVRVFGHRAPTFSIREDSRWSLEILAEEGFEYDSSIFPIRHDLYGMPNAPRFIYNHDLNNGMQLVEVPPSTVRWMGRNFGVGGGGYLRQLPMAYTRWGIKQIHQERQPVNVYFHPWEIDPAQPRIRSGWKSNLRHYRGLHKMEGHLRELFRNHRFEAIVGFVRRFQQQRCAAAV